MAANDVALVSKKESSWYPDKLDNRDLGDIPHRTQITVDDYLRHSSGINKS